MSSKPHPLRFPEDTNDPQLELEMRAFAELLLDIYEYRLKAGPDGRSGTTCASLDAAHPEFRMKERSSPEQNIN